MRSLKDIHPEFADGVDFYVVNIDPSEKLESLAEFAENQGYPWPVAQPVEDVISRLDITTQSTKVAFGRDGVIVYRAEMGRGDPEEWRELFAELSG